jgi:hypothetical protein
MRYSSGRERSKKKTRKGKNKKWLGEKELMLP